MERLTKKDEIGAFIYGDEVYSNWVVPDVSEKFRGDAVKRLAAYEDAEQEGRLVVLPCKVGDTVYRVWKTRGREPVVTAHYMTDIGMVVRWMHYFGETVFLTREEAERMLDGGTDNA